MCGICGFIGNDQSNFSYDNKYVLHSMCDVIKHRGPDGEGYLFDGGAALGHRRLSLIDIPGGAQPMSRNAGLTSQVSSPGDDCEVCSIGRYSIVFNGEIYNYRDLRNELSADGWSFSTNSDTEVLLVGYIAWEEDVLQKVRGMFAFAVWDDEERELFCARDFFGIKPFYYTMCDDGSFVFASEAKAILEHPSYDKAVNEQALVSYLEFQFPAIQETFFKGIFKLPAGHFMRVRNGEITELVRYWHMEFHPDEDLERDEAVSEIGQAMEESVSYHNVADVEVGSFLSSGVDSSYMASLLAHENPNIHTFTVGFSEYDGERDEVSWASELAALLKVDNDGERIEEDEFWEAVPKVLWHMDEPLGDPSAVALFFVDRLASRKVKAVLSGEGADELFGGYRIYNAPIAGRKVSWLPAPVLSAGSSLLGRLGLRGAEYLNRASTSPAGWYYTNANGVAFVRGELDGLLSESMRKVAKTCPAPLHVVRRAYSEVSDLDEVSRMQYVDVVHWLEGDILLKTDKMSMAHSLESRVPFLDKGVVEVASRLSEDQKVDGSNTKIAMRRAAAKAIPKQWAKKEKLGFPVPLASWLRKDEHVEEIRCAFSSEAANKFFDTGALGRMLDEHLAGKDLSRRIWIVYAFLTWHDIYFGEYAENQFS